MLKKHFHLIGLLFFLVVVFVLTMIAFILLQGFNDQVPKSDVAVILGAKVKANGAPTRALAARLSKGLDLYQQGTVRYLLVSGGTDKNGRNETVTMRNFLLRNRVPNSAIITDFHGNNTAATANHTVAIMRQYGFTSLIVVSQYFHIARIKLAMARCGITPVYSAHAPYFQWQDLYFIAREVVAYSKYWLFDRYCVLVK